MDKERVYREAGKSAILATQNKVQLYKRTFSSHSDSTGDNTILTVHGSLTPFSVASQLIEGSSGFQQRRREAPTWPNFAVHFFTSRHLIYLAPTTLWEGRKIQFCKASLQFKDAKRIPNTHTLWFRRSGKDCTLHGCSISSTTLSSYSTSSGLPSE